MLPTLPTLLRSVSALAHTEHTMRAWREVIVSRALLRLRGSLVREHWLAAARGNVAVAFGRELDAEDVLRLAGIEPTERPIPIETKVRALNVVDTFLAMVRAGGNPMPQTSPALL
ncbi:MAG: hypothetical protein NZM12_08410, partial [Steroidobacteraceae bacterium]|nr:hypothetical protein [Steroidobacteraceae bacterium]MDW8258913.1 hypothetical protein [Gammaproteobacteria bacterium]